MPVSVGLPTSSSHADDDALFDREFSEANRLILGDVDGLNLNRFAIAAVENGLSYRHGYAVVI
jgi:hypothetical protein